MGNTGGNAAVDLEIATSQKTSMDLPRDVRNYNFYQLVELLQKMHTFNPESEDWERACKLVFSANPSLGFAPADVIGLEKRIDDRLVVQTNFFGLAGAQSPLPGFILQQLVEEEREGLSAHF